MPVDWDKYEEAIRVATGGHPGDGLSLLAALDGTAESEAEEAVLLIWQGNVLCPSWQD